MTGARTYPHGVPCWVDSEQPDLDGARAFYGKLFGWTFTDAVPGAYVIASIDGADVAALGVAEGDAAPAWNTYVAVDDADASADPAGTATFYTDVFAWVFEDLGSSTMIRVPGYGARRADPRPAGRGAAADPVHAAGRRLSLRRRSALRARAA